MGRQLLGPGARSAPDVVRRLCGVQAQVASFAELAIRVRRSSSRSGDVARALSEGRLIKTWAMRGTLHLLTPEDAGSFLSLLAAGRSWERPSWERYFGITARQIDALGELVADALAGRSLTREELAAVVTRRRAFAHVGEALRSGWGTLLKPLAWRGMLCFGPSRGGRPTFTRPEDASARWARLPDPDAAAPLVIRAYFRAYGPANERNFRSWLSQGRISSRQIRLWFEAFGDHLAEVDVEGDRVLILAEDLEELARTRAAASVRLLPGFDQYVLGPGTDDGHVVPSRRRFTVSQRSGWIAPVVVVGGSVCGTWTVAGERLAVAWFKETGRPPRTELRAEARRLSAILERDLSIELTLA